MMITRILMIGAAAVAGAAGTSLAFAQAYPVPPGTVYSAPPPYPPGGYPGDYRRGPAAPDFDALDDDDMPNAPGSTALSPPGPILSPSDPRYGRPAEPPPVIYSDRPANSPPQPTYSDRGGSH